MKWSVFACVNLVSGEHEMQIPFNSIKYLRSCAGY